MTEQHFKAIVREVMDENPFAVRAVLKILDIEFTPAVKTLAVTCELKPRLLVNLDFVRSHCKNEAHIKALLCHEFLHILLRHTETVQPFTMARHIAFDAVINAIIHRLYGEEFSSMMATYYAEEVGLKKLLRPMSAEEQNLHDGAVWDAFYKGLLNAAVDVVPGLMTAWDALYKGRLNADDIEELFNMVMNQGSAFGVKDIANTNERVDVDDLLGNHSDMGRIDSDALRESLNQAMKEMNGVGIWTRPQLRGAGANSYEALFNQKDESMQRWQRAALAIFKLHLMPDPKSRVHQDVEQEYLIPALSPKDRRAFLKAQWMPFIPEAVWVGSRTKPKGTAQVYLDVSGSMNDEMPLIIALLSNLSSYIRRPFWAFSDKVSPAIIEKGQLKTQTSGGTSMSCVIEHIAETRPAAAVIVTDGYIEPLDKSLVIQTRSTRIHVVLTRDGSSSMLENAGLKYTQLDRCPA